MAGETFWNNRERAQQTIDESNSLRNKIEPLLSAEKQLEDFKVLLELGQGEPEAAQRQLETEMERDIARLLKDPRRARTQSLPEWPPRPEELHPEHQCRRGRHRGAGLGRNAFAHVHALG